MSKVYIFVPQGFYAKITATTPEIYEGLFTDGMSACAAIVATNGHSAYLCHADTALDLHDTQHGLYAWIHQMQSELPGFPMRVSYTCPPDPFGKYFRDEIGKIVSASERSASQGKKHPPLQVAVRELEYTTGASVNRNGHVACLDDPWAELAENAERDGYREELVRTSSDLSDYKDAYAEMRDSVVQARDVIARLRHRGQYTCEGLPPICIFDGHLLNREDISREYPESKYPFLKRMFLSPPDAPYISDTDSRRSSSEGETSKSSERKSTIPQPGKH